MKAYNAKVRERDGVSAMAKYRRKARGQNQTAVVLCTVCKSPLKRVAPGKMPPVHKACIAGRDYLRNGFTESHMVRKFRAKIDKAAAGRDGGKRVFVSGGCEWCGDSFVAAAGMYCSDSCKKSSKFSRRSSGASFNISPRARLAIYERDGWTCQLCMMPVDGLLHYRDKWAASLDHIIPQSHQIVPDHSPSNLRLAHIWCNSARGNGSNMSENEAVSRAIEMQEAA